MIYISYNYYVQIVDSKFRALNESGERVGSSIIQAENYEP
jgi:hypothetical protein